MLALCLILSKEGFLKVRFYEDVFINDFYEFCSLIDSFFANSSGSGLVGRDNRGVGILWRREFSGKIYRVKTQLWIKKIRLLKIKKYPQEVLRWKCKPIERITENYVEFFRQMLITMNYKQ